MSTKAILILQPITGNEKIITWLEHYHGEAPGQQVMNTFVSWGINNKTSFATIVSSLSQKTLERIAWAITDIDAGEQYSQEFSGSNSTNIKYIVNKIQANQDESANKEIR